MIQRANVQDKENTKFNNNNNKTVILLINRKEDWRDSQVGKVIVLHNAN